MKIDNTQIPSEVKYVAETLESHGFEAYIVGGCTRDLILGKAPKDWDLTTNAHPTEIQSLFPDHYANNDYGTIGVKPNPKIQRFISLRLPHIVPKVVIVTLDAQTLSLLEFP